MILERARLKNFRNHNNTEIYFSPRVNIFIGQNGQGKTNILEALTYLSLTKSIFSSSDLNLVKHNTGFFNIDGSFYDDRQIRFNVSAHYSEKEKRKTFLINSAPIKKLSTVIGSFPVVALFPEHLKITSGSPAERRKFVDIALSQTDPLYVESLLKYKKALQQRNALLSNKNIFVSEETLEPWSEQIIEHGTEIIFERNKFFRDFEKEITASYKKITEENESPSVKYKPTFEISDVDTKKVIAEKFRTALNKIFTTEKKIRTSIVGPHRDDIELLLNGTKLNEFASRGQHKTFLVALKNAEFAYLKHRTKETPILILDDLFSELDENRAKKVFENFTSQGQTFVTSAQNIFYKTNEGDTKIFIVENGSVKQEEIKNYA